MTRTSTKWRTLRLLVPGALLTLAALAIVASPAFAAGTLTNISWTVSNSQVSKTAVAYSFAFKTATAGTIKTVTMTVPSGTAGTPAVGTVYGLGAGTASLAGTTLTYTVTSAVSVPANIPIYVSFTGLTNTGAAGSYTSSIATNTAVPAVIDSGTSQSVTFGSSSTTASVTVGQTLTFTNSTPSFNLAVDPTGLSSQTATVTLTVQTNASSGYTLAAYDAGLSKSSPAFTIPAVSTGPGTGVATFPGSGFGVSATLSTGGTDGASLASGLSGSKWVGYPSSAANFLTTTGPTGATPDTLTLTNQVGVDYSVPAGAYSDTITYVATPTY
jgi:hypothetical protein